MIVSKVRQVRRKDTKMSQKEKKMKNQDVGKYIWTTKVSNKGQVVIPKEAR